MKNITISVEEGLWSRIKDAAANERLSMNRFINEKLEQTVGSPGASLGQRLVFLAEEIGPAPRSWTWKRDEIYDEKFSEKFSDVRRH